MSNSQFRPTDNSPSTRAKFDLEAEHWTRSFKHAQSKNKKTDFKSDFATIGLFSTVLFSFLILIVASLTDFIKWIRSLSREIATNKTSEQEKHEQLKRAWEVELNELNKK